MLSLLLILGGILAGIINTLAGNGSVITLTLCTELIGLSTTVANGTNRLGVLTQSMSGALALKKHNKLLLTDTFTPMICVLCGSLVGIWLATAINENSFRKLYPYFLLFVFLVLILKPDRWIHEKLLSKPVMPWYLYIILFLVGVYGGLIQLGVGVFFLASMILIGKHPWSHANAAKIVIVGVFTLLAVIVFGFHGMIHLKTGIALALGQWVGAWLAVRYLVRFPQAQATSYYILLAVTGLTLLRYFIL